MAKDMTHHTFESLDEASRAPVSQYMVPDDQVLVPVVVWGQAQLVTIAALALMVMEQSRDAAARSGQQ